MSVKQKSVIACRYVTSVFENSNADVNVKPVSRLIYSVAPNMRIVIIDKGIRAAGVPSLLGSAHGTLQDKIVGFVWSVDGDTHSTICVAIIPLPSKIQNRATNIARWIAESTASAVVAIRVN